MNPDELSELCTRMPAYLEKAAEQQKVDMIFMMLTSIIDEAQRFFAYGKIVKDRSIIAFKQLTDGRLNCQALYQERSSLYRL